MFFIVEIGQVFPQPLYLRVAGTGYFSFIRWQRILLLKCFLLVILMHFWSKIRCQRMKEKSFSRISPKPSTLHPEP